MQADFREYCCDVVFDGACADRQLFADLPVGRRQLSWPVDDNYLGRLRA
jgi:hypothetical protein